MKSYTWLQGSFTEHFVQLQSRFGEEAADVRHELFYLGAGRSRLVRDVRAFGALLRDIRLLWRRGTGLSTTTQPQAILLTTLQGSSGWGALERSVKVLVSAGFRPVVLAHPRLPLGSFTAGLDVVWPASVDGKTLRAALVVFITCLVQWRSLLVASCLTRRTLWRGSLARTLANSRGVLLLHNDFDLMSRAAIGHGVPTVCLQHGVPTDEFFPTRADWYLIWGDSSRQAFTAADSRNSQLVEDALGRGQEQQKALQAPESLALLSQTHAQVFGDGVHSALLAFADELLKYAPQANILLHPLERMPYRGLAAQACRRPPHPQLQPGSSPPGLLIGYCSTAMLDAALAGHWVVALQLPLDGNYSARTVLAAPLRAETAEQAVALYQRLREDDDFRRSASQAQLEWLRVSFSRQPGGLAALLRQIYPQPSTEPVQ